MFDVIGDIHGHANELESLLHILGYERKLGAYRHASRSVIFLGDWIDRGPSIRQTLEIVREMVEAKSAQAIIGNHELNALAWATPKSSTDSVTDSHNWCRAHTEKNERIHRATLMQLSPAELTEWLNWFRTIPWWLDLKHLRCVHACWDAAGINVLAKAFGNSWTTTDKIIQAVHQEGSLEANAMESILKGPELTLPQGCTLPDPEGFLRKVIRVRWFNNSDAKTYAQLAFPRREGVSNEALPIDFASKVPSYAADQPPVFIGHYWIPPNAVAEPLAPNVACVDYSVALGGRLMAYRWSGENILTRANFVSVPARSEAAPEKYRQGNFSR